MEAISLVELERITGGTLPWYHPDSDPPEEESHQSWLHPPEDPPPSHTPWIHDESKVCTGGFWHACPPIKKDK